jgi:hypothetical protein
MTLARRLTGPRQAPTINVSSNPRTRIVTKIWLLSDLHQEFVRDPDCSANPLTAFDPGILAPADFDVVVLAGDIDVPLTKSLHWAADHFPGVPVI